LIDKKENIVFPFLYSSFELEFIVVAFKPNYFRNWPMCGMEHRKTLRCSPECLLLGF